MQKYTVLHYKNEKKKRALALIGLFKRRIEQGLFDVEMANWWSAGSPDKVILRIDANVNNLEDLEKFDHKQ